MSYDISLAVELKEPHHLKGGTYVMGGTTDASLNVTYNYSAHFCRVMGEKGIRTIYGMSADESLPVLAKAVCALGDDTVDNYWTATEGNAKAALLDLMTLAMLAIRQGDGDALWDGD